MDIVAIRIVVIVLSIILLGLCVAMLCKKTDKSYFNLIIFSIFCFILSTLYLVYIFAFSREKGVEYSLFLLGVVAGYLLYIVVKNIKSEYKVEVKPQSNVISFLVSIVVALSFIFSLIMALVNNRGTINVVKLIFTILVVIVCAVTLFYLLRNVLTPSKGNKKLKLIKYIDILTIVEIILTISFSICIVINNLLAMGILVIIFMLIQYAVLYLVYRGNKNE